MKYNKDIDDFNELKIDDKTINRLSIECLSYHYNDESLNTFFEKLFSFQLNNLAYLDINKIKVYAQSFEKINNLSLL